MEHQIEGARSAQSGGFDIVLLHDAQQNRADPRGKAGDGNDGQRQHHVEHAAAQNGQEHQGQQEGRNTGADVDDSHDDEVRPFGQGADGGQQRADQQGGQSGAHADAHGDSCAVENPGEQIPAQVVRAEPVLRAGRRQLGAGVVGSHQLLRNQKIGKDNGKQDHGKNDQANQRCPVAHKALDHVGKQAVPGIVDHFLYCLEGPIIDTSPAVSDRSTRRRCPSAPWRA